MSLGIPAESIDRIPSDIPTKLFTEIYAGVSQTISAGISSVVTLRRIPEEFIRGIS